MTPIIIRLCRFISFDPPSGNSLCPRRERPSGRQLRFLDREIIQSKDESACRAHFKLAGGYFSSTLPLMFKGRALRPQTVGADDPVGAPVVLGKYTQATTWWRAHPVAAFMALLILILFAAHLPIRLSF